eukprot:scaffold46_cov196-Ochromonas_danica.AAC.2
MASIYRYFPNQAFNFAFKDQYKRWFTPYLPPELETKRKMINNIVAGGLAGGFSLFLCHPFDVARTKLAADSGVERSVKTTAAEMSGGPHIRQYRGTFHCLLSTYQQQGIRGVYAGAPISIVGAIIYRGLHFGGYDTMKEMLATSNDYKNSLIARYLAAQIASLFVGVTCYPLDTVRRRMMVQNQHHTYDDNTLVVVV